MSRSNQPSRPTTTVTSNSYDEDADLDQDDHDTPTAAAERAARLERLLQSASSISQAEPDLDQQQDQITNNNSSSSIHRTPYDEDPAIASDRASMYSELHSYLDELQHKVDLDGYNNELNMHPALVDSTSTIQQILHGSSTPAANPITPTRPPSRPLTRNTPTPSCRPPSSFAQDRESKELESPTRSSNGGRRGGGGAILPVSPSTIQSPSRRVGSTPPSNTTLPALTSSASEEKNLEHDRAYFEGEDDTLPPLDANFDEMKEMDKIAELDALIAEADARSSEIEQRLHALLAAPLPSIAGEPVPPISDPLLLMPGSPTSSLPTHSQAPSSSADSGQNDFFMTSVPGAGGAAEPTSPTSAAVQKGANGTAPTNPPVDATNIWELEEVDELDAPLVLSSGEGFRPSAEDQGKLDEIDALLNHFRSSDSGLPAAYRPRFKHPPIKKKRNVVKKKPTAPAATTSNSALTVIPYDVNDDEDEDGAVDTLDSPSAAASFDPSTLASRVSALVPSSTALTTLGTNAIAGGSLMDLALENPTSLEMTEEEQRELKQFQKQVRQVTKTTKASEKDKTALTVDSEYLKKLLAKTQSSYNNPNSSPSSSFPTFTFPKSIAAKTSTITPGSTTINLLNLNSTDAIFAAMEREEKEMRRLKREAKKMGVLPSQPATNQTTSNAPSNVPTSRTTTSSEDIEREMTTAIDDENEYEEEEVETPSEPDSEDEADGGAATVDDNPAISKNPRVRMDQLAAQVAAIRSRVYEDGEDFHLASQPSHSSSSPDQSSKDGGPRLPPRERTTSAGLNHRSIDSSLPISSQTLSASRPRSQPLDSSFEDSFNTFPMTGSPLSHRLGSPSLSSSSAISSLADRLDQAIGRSTPNSAMNSARSGTGAESWRTWQPPRDGPGAELNNDMQALGSAARIRAAARGGLLSPGSGSGGPATINPLTRSIVNLAVSQRPIRPGSTSAQSNSIYGSSIQSARGGNVGLSPSANSFISRSTTSSRPASANSIQSSSIDLPKLQTSSSRQGQASLSKTMTWK